VEVEEVAVVPVVFVCGGVKVGGGRGFWCGDERQVHLVAFAGESLESLVVLEDFGFEGNECLASFVLAAVPEGEADGDGCGEGSDDDWLEAGEEG
jgi:hypothetical protein